MGALGAVAMRGLKGVSPLRIAGPPPAPPPVTVIRLIWVHGMNALRIWQR